MTQDCAKSYLKVSFGILKSALNFKFLEPSLSLQKITSHKATGGYKTSAIVSDPLGYVATYIKGADTSWLACMGHVTILGE